MKPRSFLAPLISTIVAKGVVPAAKTEAGPALINMLPDMDENAVLKLKVSLFIIAATSIPWLLMNDQVSKHLQSRSWLYRLLWALAFGLNLFTVSLPGRFDGQTKDSKVDIPWTTLFEPAPWAFAIWAAIYLGELLLTAYVALVGKPSAAFKEAVPYWAAGNMFQSMWCFCFRPQFKTVLWLPMMFLGLSAISFAGSHQILTNSIESISTGFFALDKLLLVLCRSPIALHTGWLAAATLLNLNGWASVSKASAAIQIMLAFASVFIGTSIGAVLSIRTKDFLIAGTVAWAITAVAYKTREKMSSPNNIAAKDTLAALALSEDFASNALQILAALLFIYPFTKLFAKSSE